ncbi:MAG: hypothetical protein H0U23_09570 [Blastocatellia bacterium]|nr:hypothetical protein [Blastocatellia bacterium]
MKQSHRGLRKLSEIRKTSLIELRGKSLPNRSLALIALCIFSLGLQSCETTVSTPFPERMASGAVTLSAGDVVKLTFAGACDLFQ